MPAQHPIGCAHLFVRLCERSPAPTEEQRDMTTWRKDLKKRSSEREMMIAVEEVCGAV